MLRKIFCLIAAATVLAAFFASPADAARRHRQYYYATPYAYDRAIGRPHTCGFPAYQYDNRGVPMGPYCH